MIRAKLEKFRKYKMTLDDEEISWEHIVEIELKLKSYFLDEPLENIVKLATDIFYVFTEE